MSNFNRKCGYCGTCEVCVAKTRRDRQRARARIWAREHYIHRKAHPNSPVTRAECLTFAAWSAARLWRLHPEVLEAWR